MKCPYIKPVPISVYHTRRWVWFTLNSPFYHLIFQLEYKVKERNTKTSSTTKSKHESTSNNDNGNNIMSHGKLNLFLYDKNSHEIFQVVVVIMKMMMTINHRKVLVVVYLYQTVIWMKSMMRMIRMMLMMISKNVSIDFLRQSINLLLYIFLLIFTHPYINFYFLFQCVYRSIVRVFTSQERIHERIFMFLFFSSFLTVCVCAFENMEEEERGIFVVWIFFSVLLTKKHFQVCLLFFFIVYLYVYDCLLLQTHSVFVLVVFS